MMVVLWGAVSTAMVLAVGFALRQRNDPQAPTGAGSTRPEGVPARIDRSRADNDEFYRRLM
ncbi:hypothetical protein MAHJHV55_45030 [Mycobacterium avium subsp. hominissuis]